MKKKIMVVDDDIGVIYTIKHGMKNLEPDYEIITANNGKKCIEMLENNEIPDLILLDIMMPEMTGWETYQKIREIKTCNELPVIFLTARKDKVAKNAGGFLAEDYIEKPFKMPDLKQRIDKVLK